MPKKTLIFFALPLASYYSLSTFAAPNSTPLTGKLSDGVTGNTLDFDSRKSRFEPWSDNYTARKRPFSDLRRGVLAFGGFGPAPTKDYFFHGNILLSPTTIP
jgi:hypothetical protein